MAASVIGLAEDYLAIPWVDAVLPATPELGHVTLVVGPTYREPNPLHPAAEEELTPERVAYLPELAEVVPLGIVVYVRKPRWISITDEWRRWRFIDRFMRTETPRFVVDGIPVEPYSWRELHDLQRRDLPADPRRLRASFMAEGIGVADPYRCGLDEIGDP